MANSGLFEIAVIGDAVGRKNWLVAGRGFEPLTFGL